MAKPLPVKPTGLNEIPEVNNVPPDDAVYQLIEPGNVNVTVICIKSTAAFLELFVLALVAAKTAPKLFELISAGDQVVFHKSVAPP